MIIVGRKSDPNAEYIGRGSPLGNPFPMSCEADRDQVCDMYETWFNEQVQDRNPRVMAELDRLLEIARRRTLVLGCFCAPKRCHGRTIKKFLTDLL